MNDKDAFLCNFWRAVHADPDAVAQYAAWPVNECDLHARHAWLVPQRAILGRRLEGDPDFYDAKIAGWWCWGLCCWIGGGWCGGNGPWQVIDGHLADTGNAGQGVRRQLPHLGDAGRGVQRQLPHLGNAGRGVQRQLPHLGNAGQGVRRQIPHLGNGDPLRAWMTALSARLERVRVCCGDWTRVMGPSVTFHHGLTGILLDPPYAETEREGGLYTEEGTFTEAIQAWCLANGTQPLLRIVLCGYEGEYALPGWRQLPWKTNGGMGNQRQTGDNANKYRERLWLSPACLDTQLSLFGETP